MVKLNNIGVKLYKIVIRDLEQIILTKIPEYGPLYLLFQKSGRYFWWNRPEYPNINSDKDGYDLDLYHEGLDYTIIHEPLVGELDIDDWFVHKYHVLRLREFEYIQKYPLNVKIGQKVMYRDGTVGIVAQKLALFDQPCFAVYNKMFTENIGNVRYQNYSDGAYTNFTPDERPDKQIIYVYDLK